MTYLKVVAVAAFTFFAVEGAEASVVESSSKAPISASVFQQHRRTVVVQRRVYRRPHRHAVVRRSRRVIVRH